MTETQAPYMGQASAALGVLLRDRVVAYHPALARAAGSINAGILLSQLAYWCGRAEDGWGYRTQAELTEETALSDVEQHTARKLLRDRGFLTEERRGLPARLYYHVEPEIIAAALETTLPCDKTPVSHPMGAQIPAGRESIQLVENNKETSNRDGAAAISPSLLPPDYPEWAEEFSRLEPLPSPAEIRRIITVGEEFAARGIQPTAGLVARCISYWAAKKSTGKADWARRLGAFLERERTVLPFSDPPLPDEPARKYTPAEQSIIDKWIEAKNGKPRRPVTTPTTA